MNHIAKHHDNSIPIFKCEICKCETTDNNAFEMHMAIHDVALCAHCLYETQLKSSQMTHMLLHKSDSLQMKEFVKCPACSYKTKLKSLLAAHMKSHCDSITEFNRKKIKKAQNAPQKQFPR